MLSFLQRDAPAVGRVLYRGSIAPPVDQLSVFRDAVTWKTVTPGAEQVWAVEVTHPRWGAAEIACDRHPPSLADAIIDHSVGLSSDEKAHARHGRATVAVRVRTQQKQVLRDRKGLLFWMRALMQPDGVIAVDGASMLLWSKPMLDDELAHDADVDIESLYAIHAVQDQEDAHRVSWLHTHGLAQLGAFDIDMLQPSAMFVNQCADPIRAVAFAALEGTIAPTTERFSLAYPGGDVRFVPVDKFDGEASPEHRKLREPDEDHSGRRAVICEPAGGWFSSRRKTPVPSRFLSENQDDSVVFPFSHAATALMAERARQTLGVFTNLKEEFASLDLPALVKLGYEVEGGAPTDREHLWFAVHRLTTDKVDATLANTPHRVPGLTVGQRGEHDLARLTDWTILSPEGAMTPRNIGAARRLRANREMWQARIDAARKDS